MDQPRREQLHHLVENPAEEFVSEFDGRIERVVRISLHGAIAVRGFLPVRQFRIGDEGSRTMAGNIDFRHDFHIQRRRMGNDNAHIVLGIITGDRFRAVAKLRQKRRIRAACGADRGQ